MAKITVNRRSFVVLVVALATFLTWTTFTILSPNKSIFSSKGSFFIPPEGLMPGFGISGERGLEKSAEVVDKPLEAEVRKEKEDLGEGSREIGHLDGIVKDSRVVAEGQNEDDTNREQPANAQKRPTNDANDNNNDQNQPFEVAKPIAPPDLEEKKNEPKPAETVKNRGVEDPNNPLIPDALDSEEHDIANPEEDSKEHGQDVDIAKITELKAALHQFANLTANLTHLQKASDLKDSSHPEVLPMPDRPIRSPEQEAFEASLQMDQFRLRLANFELDYKLLKPNDTSLCKGKKALVMVMSVANSDKAKRQRYALREILQNQTNSNIIFKFIVGYQKDMMVDVLQHEIRDYNDIVYYDAEDTYYNNFIKWYVMYEWQQAYCKDAEYFVKMDDDSVVLFDRLFKWVDRNFDGKTTNKTDYVICQMVFRKGPIRNPRSKWYVPEFEYPEERYPDWCTGFVAFMPSTTVGKLFEASHSANKLHIDDVLFTGIAGRIAKVPLIDFQGARERLRTNYRCTEDGLPYPFATHYNKVPYTLMRSYNRLLNLWCKPKKPVEKPS
ncbi:unnamed protein product [Bursaphelenchus xylophilus]|uniref:(pine wood nematode) hypothetical protein n=1 Tax=Bursaphelenchus xylophilus TaxID=6326 RepID=A0A1I7SFH9_BURXY|nr:unnamed protein product [Bursaphelenchus xylophilus]CAG9079042.1 unnamed protein product [Bursaphelenchus xylophilus]